MRFLITCSTTVHALYCSLLGKCPCTKFKWSIQQLLYTGIESPIQLVMHSCKTISRGHLCAFKQPWTLTQQTMEYQHYIGPVMLVSSTCRCSGVAATEWLHRTPQTSFPSSSSSSLLCRHRATGSRESLPCHQGDRLAILLDNGEDLRQRWSTNRVTGERTLHQLTEDGRILQYTSRWMLEKWFHVDSPHTLLPQSLLPLPPILPLSFSLPPFVLCSPFHILLSIHLPPSLPQREYRTRSNNPNGQK